MAFDNTNRGSLNKNDRKEKPTHPDYRGQINVGGEDYWLDAWIKDGPKGKWMSLSAKPKDPVTGSRSEKPVSVVIRAPEVPDDEPLPF